MSHPGTAANAKKPSSLAARDINGGNMHKPIRHSAICVLVATTGLFLGTRVQASGAQCLSWDSDKYPLVVSACSYESGSSGYYIIENRGDVAAHVCWTVISNSGMESRSCHLHLDAGAKTEGSCYTCGLKNGGTREIRITSYTPKR